MLHFPYIGYVKQFAVKSILIFLLVVQVLGAIAQVPYSKRLTVENGLPSNEILDMLYDSRGRIWFATPYGVTTYDGYDFTSYTTRDGLPENSTIEILEDNEQRIWFYSMGNHISYMEDGEIIPLNIPDRIHQEMSLHNRLFRSDSAGNMIIGTRKTFSKQTGDGWDEITASDLNQITCHSFNPDIIRSLKINNIEIDSHYTIINFWGALGIHFSTSGRKEKKHLLRLNNVKIDDDNYILYTSRSIIQVSNNEVVYSEHIRNKQRYISVFCDDDRNIWVSRWSGGLMRYKKSLLDVNPDHWFHKETISKILQDREGNYWISMASGKGVYVIPSLQFQTFMLKGTNEYYVNSIEICGPDLFLSVYFKGIYKTDLSNPLKIISPFLIPDFISKNFLDIYCHTDGTLWGASDHPYRFEASGTPLPLVVRDNEPSGCNQVIGSSDGSVYFIGHYFLRKYYSEDSVQRITSKYLRQPRNACEGLDGELYIGGVNGLSVLRNGIEYDLGEEMDGFHSRITDLKIYDSLLFIGTRGNGLFVYNGRDTLLNLMMEDGLASNNINVIFREKPDHFWIGSDKGLDHLVFADGINGDFIIKNYNTWDGLPSGEIMDIESTDNQIFLGTSKGLVSFYPDKLQSLLIPPLLFIESVKVDDSLVDYSRPIEMDYDENAINISYKGISFKDPGRVVYKYQLKGMDKDWILTNNTSARYADLPPGSYEFQLLSANSKGHWNPEPIIIFFTVERHFTQTWIFYGLMILALIGIMMLIFYIILKGFKQRAETRRKLLISEHKALRTQMNPHFLFNSLNSIQHFIFNKDEVSANRFIRNFADLMQEILESSKHNTVRLANEIKLLQNYLTLEQMRTAGKFDFEVSVEPGIDINDTRIPPMLIQPYVENAIWHGILLKKTKGLVHINIQEAGEDMLLAIINDDGIGRKAASEIRKQKSPHTPTAMKNIRERIALFNKLYKQKLEIRVIDKYDDNNMALGTCVEILIPCFD